MQLIIANFVIPNVGDGAPYKGSWTEFFLQVAACHSCCCGTNILIQFSSILREKQLSYCQLRTMLKIAPVISHIEEIQISATARQGYIYKGRPRKKSEILTFFLCEVLLITIVQTEF